jgi:manganese-dependent inorganic pyrophosphatase
MNLNDKIYIVGHKRPDLDSIASAIGYQEYMKYKGYFNYCAISSGEINNLTKWVLDKFKTSTPQLIPNISGMNIILVDHSDIKQRPKGYEDANILEIIDHHEPEIEDLTLQNSNIQECGATSTLIAEMILRDNLSIETKTAGILLSAILDDTVGLESPTTTNLDTETVYTLANICNIQDIEEFSKQLISKKDIWNELTSREIIEMDMKEDNINGNTLSISQVETMNNAQLHSDDILTELKKLDKENPLNLRIVMLTDLSNRKCILLVVGKDIDIFEKVLNKQIINNTVVLSNVISRKKQIIPILEQMYI